RKINFLLLFGYFYFIGVWGLRAQDLQFSPETLFILTKASDLSNPSDFKKFSFLKEDSTNKSFQADFAGTKFSREPFNLSYPFLPEFARVNPAGHSYLCRMEVNVEKNLPVPLWIRAGKVQDWESYNSTAMYLQVKLLGFKQ
ncbi:MAG: hypothetical protein AAGA10_06090, partial [Bacteroidota bacterium]